MAWPNYHFVDLGEAEKRARRETLNRYALYAQLSALVPVAAILLCRLLTRAASSRGSSGDYTAIPSSPVRKERRNSGLGSWASRARRAQWWLGEDVVAFGTVLGQRDQWVVGLAWTAWLLVLSVLDTGEDYLHLTKRLGIVAVSQWPLQYLLALKSLNPVAYLLRSSHEQVNRWHRVLARVTTTLICAHATLYLAFFVNRDRLDRLGDPVVFAGVAAFQGLMLLVTTALRPVRRYSYRLFFVIHLTAAIVVPIMLVIHAAPAKPFLFESLFVFFLDLASRKMDTVTGKTTVESIPGTDLIRIRARIPRAKINRFRAHPGAHIYLSVPAAARTSMSATSSAHLLFEFLFNPFTVAAVDESSGQLTLVARRRSGPMTAALGRFAGAARPSNGNGVRQEIPLSIEGPYGAASRLPRLYTDFDRVLLVAGGVGATFTLPLFQSIVRESPATKVDMVWAVRGAGDATWAVTSEAAEGILRDDRIHLYVTGNTPPASDEPGEELGALHRDRRGGPYTAQHARRRPDLKRIVDDTFKYNEPERLAVLVCGPKEMARELRAHLGVWVGRGRSVWFHSEGFGF